MAQPQQQQQQQQGAPTPPVPNVTIQRNQPNQNINTVKIRVPPFWKNDPELWFLQIEAQFALCNITTDLLKYNTVVGNVDPNILDPVKDIIRTPPANNKYQTIKDRLIKKYTESDNTKIKTLLTELTLGDNKPSDLLNKMQDLSCGKVGDDLLRILWLQRLPFNIQSILACSTDTLQVMSTMADKIYEATQNASIQVIDSSSKTNGDLAEMIHSIEDKINNLNRKIDMSTPRIGSKSPKRPTPHDPDTGNCWYHDNYGHKARKACNPPCAFVTNKNNNNKTSKNESAGQKRRLTPARK